ncbi:bifunctional 2-polyprenyl-6-hydroxyphenol methylase/3-demethylubiquinol 3-O-methyltransferase UbiG [Alloactinosynnema sp. L-07]|uniref:class I SAM-dependent methyltransferase n=1 Tax=Alloactinosynnema sp. L-07 TaxID=1653480 RepID=UPI000836967B|nr:class I SAM-dependent methyltransferase [Alloactinosynnema sp. L-07]
MTLTVQWPEFVDTAALREHERMRLMEEVFDPFSIANLDRIGVRAGWRCLEVGAGGGSIARAMADRAGGANVVATDLSIRLLGPLTDLGVTVLRHDVTADEAPGEFDLIHARFVLDHLPGRDAALARMASWLRPGGWLLLEVGSTAPELSSRPEVAAAMAAGNAVLAGQLGTHTSWARTMPLPLSAAGLSDCAAVGQAVAVRGGGPMARWLKETYSLVDDRVVAAGLMSRDGLDQAYAAMADPSFVDYTWLTVAATGRRN